MGHVKFYRMNANVRSNKPCSINSILWTKCFNMFCWIYAKRSLCVRNEQQQKKKKRIKIVTVFDSNVLYHEYGLKFMVICAALADS